MERALPPYRTSEPALDPISRSIAAVRFVASLKDSGNLSGRNSTVYRLEGVAPQSRGRPVLKNAIEAPSGEKTGAHTVYADAA